MEIIISFLSVTAIIGWLLVGYLLYRLHLLNQDYEALNDYPIKPDDIYDEETNF